VRSVVKSTTAATTSFRITFIRASRSGRVISPIEKVKVMSRHLISRLATGVTLAGAFTGLLAATASMFVGQLDIIEQYAPGVGSSGPLCYVGVVAAQVQNKAACASSGSRYYYSWDCDDPRRKNFIGLATAAYLSDRKVQLIGTGQCSPHPSYENLDYFIISENP
jgi:hypothetical protein